MIKMQSFRGARSRNIKLATHNSKIYIPKPLCKNIIDWYHKYLMYPGDTSTKETIKHQLYSPTPTKIGKRHNKNI